MESGSSGSAVDSKLACLISNTFFNQPPGRDFFLKNFPSGTPQSKICISIALEIIILIILTIKY